MLSSLFYCNVYLPTPPSLPLNPRSNISKLIKTTEVTPITTIGDVKIYDKVRSSKIFTKLLSFTHCTHLVLVLYQLTFHSHCAWIAEFVTA